MPAFSFRRNAAAGRRQAVLKGQVQDPSYLKDSIIEWDQLIGEFLPMAPSLLAALTSIHVPSQSLM